jgi:hypothetical protein
MASNIKVSILRELLLDWTAGRMTYDEAMALGIKRGISEEEMKETLG